MAQTATRLPIRTEAGKPVQAAAWPPFENLRNEIDRLFDNFGFTARPRRPAFGFDLAQPAGDWAIAPAVDVAEKDGDFEITAELETISIAAVNMVCTRGQPAAAPSSCVRLKTKNAPSAVATAMPGPRLRSLFRLSSIPMENIRKTNPSCDSV